MSVKRKVLVSVFGTGWAVVMGMAFLPVYIHYLGIESYGLIGFFVTLQTWLFLLDMGLSSTLNREMSRFSAGLRNPQGIRDLLKSMEVVYGGMAAVLAVLIIWFSPVIALDWLNLQTLSVHTASQALVIMGFLIAVQWMGTLYRSALLGLQHQVWLGLTTAGIATLRAAGTVIVLAFVAPTIAAFLIFQCAISVVETIILAWYVHSCLPRAPQSPRFSLATLKGVKRFATELTVLTFLATLLTQVDKLLLARLLPLDQYGYFSFAVVVAGALPLAVGPIQNVAYPRLTELVAAGDELTLASEYHQFAQLLSIIVMPGALVLCVFSREIIFLWTQNAIMTQWVSPIVSVWVTGAALNGLMQVPYAAQLAHGWVRLAITVNTVAVVIMIPAMLFWVPKHGAIAAAWIWVAINMGYCIFFIAGMHTRVLRREKWTWYFQDTLRPFAASTFSVLGMLGLFAVSPPASRIGGLTFFLVGTAVVVFVTALATPLGWRLFKYTYHQLRAKKNDLAK